MIINTLLIILFLLIINSLIKTLNSKNEKRGFMSIETTDSIRGIATIMIVFSHIRQYEASFSEIILGGGQDFKSNIFMGSSRCFFIFSIIRLRMLLFYNKSGQLSVMDN